MTSSQPATRPRSPYRIAMINGGLGDPSSTRMLAERVVTSLRAGAGAVEQIEVSTLTLRDLAVDIAQATVAGVTSRALTQAIDAVSNSDGAILATPIYKATFSGLFKSFIDLLDNDALLARPVILAATGGSARHALAVDMALRPLAGYLRALAVPTALYAAPEDWSTSGPSGLGSRIDRAAAELWAMLRTTVTADMLKTSSRSYQRTLDLDPESEQEIVLDPDMLRAATGGSLLG